jgi:CheY-like chemotaxis protein
MKEFGVPEAAESPRERLAVLGRLTGGIVHDFNHLLTVLRAHLDGLRTAQGPEQAELLNSLEGVVRQAEALTARLVALARSNETGSQPLSFTERVNPGTLAVEVGELLRRVANPGVTLEVRARPGLPSVKMEPGALTQLLLNLYLNAYEAMPGGGRLVVEVDQLGGDKLCDPLGSSPPAASSVLAPGIRIRVSDSGPGMPHDVQARIFEPMFSTKEGKDNAGLGLAIVSDIVRRHGGRIDLLSSPSRGTCFEVVLPFAPGSNSGGAFPRFPPAENSGKDCEGSEGIRQAAPLPRGSYPTTPSATAAPGLAPSSLSRPPSQKRTVLVVDNDPSLRQLVRTILERNHYIVLVAADGREAVEAYRTRTGPIDVVLLDLNMPVVSGTEAMEQLERIDPGVRVVLTSGSLMDYPGPLPAAFLPKPYVSADLLAAVATALGIEKASPQPKETKDGTQ